MAREQLGICAEANLHASYLLCNVLDGQEAILRQKLLRIPQILQRLAEHFSESMLTGLVAISSHYWDSLYPWQRPAGLQAFPVLPSEHLAVSCSMADLLIQVRSDRLDVNYIALQQIQQLLLANIEVSEQLSGFRYLDGRQLTGFPDAPQNPRGIKRRQAALVPAVDSAIFAGGSYLHFYRANLDLKHWQQLTVAQQEEILGFAKTDGKPLPAERVLPNSHLQCSLAGGLAPLPLLQQNMPFVQGNSQGLLLLNFSHQAECFAQQWHYRLGLNEGRYYDSLLDFYRIDLAAAFFVPALGFLEAAANGSLSASSDLFE